MAGHDQAEAVDAGLLGGLAEGRGGQARVAVDVAAGLEPAPELAVQHQQRAGAGGVDHQRGAGEVALGAGPQQGVGMALDERQHVALVLDGRTLDGRGLDVAAAAARSVAEARRGVIGRQEGQVHRGGALAVGHRRECAPPAHPAVAVGRLTTASTRFGSPGTLNRQATSVATEMPTRGPTTGLLGGGMPSSTIETPPRPSTRSAPSCSRSIPSAWQSLAGPLHRSVVPARRRTCRPHRLDARAAAPGPAAAPHRPRRARRTPRWRTSACRR